MLNSSINRLVQYYVKCTLCAGIWNRTFYVRKMIHIAYILSNLVLLLESKILSFRENRRLPTSDIYLRVLGTPSMSTAVILIFSLPSHVEKMREKISFCSFGKNLFRRLLSFIPICCFWSMCQSYKNNYSIRNKTKMALKYSKNTIF